MPPVRTIRNVLMELRKVCQHPYLSAPELENEDAPEEEQQKQLTEAAGKLAFLKLLLPKLKERGHRILLFSQFKIALNIVEDFLYGEGYKYLRLDGDVQQAQRQKSLDAFNAPDSDYFVFLLTTRAGGVGINLATADTVIIYDPDFNPHMDLQAISRSHRYGQTKKVLVFKLMTKNSVEEQIVLNGKKKMVLDHLVVQQMGKESEEGDIDDLLLKGAAALYEANEDGVAASDIRYSSKDVDDLIDKVEADAEAEAKALEEKEKQRAEGAEKGEEGQDAAVKPSKEAMSFGFAKIWERNRLEELPDEQEERPEDMTAAWQLVMENAIRSRQAEQAAIMESGRAKRTAATVRYRIDGILSDESPQKSLVNGRRKQKGKRKAGQSSSEDADFNIEANASSGSDTDSAASDGFDLYDESGRATARGLAAGKKRLTKKQQEALAAVQAAAAQTLAHASGDQAGPSQPAGTLGISAQGDIGAATIPPAAEASTSQPSQSVEPVKPAKETPEERAARKAQEKKDKRAKKDAARQRAVQGYEAQLAAEAQASVAGPSRPPDPAFDDRHVAPIIPGQPGQPAPPPYMDPAVITAGQQVCQYLYHICREFDLADELEKWALMALPELPGQQRERLYRDISRIADKELFHRNQEGYFLHPAQLGVALPLLRGGCPVIPDNPGLPELPPLRQDMGVWNPKGRAMAQEAQQQRIYAAHVPSPYQSPRQSPPPLLASTRLPTPPMIPVPPPQARSGLSSSFLQPSAQVNGGPSHFVQDQRREMFDSMMDNQSRLECPFCSQPHTLADCPTVPSVPELLKIRDSIILDKVAIDDKHRALQKIETILRLRGLHDLPVPTLPKTPHPLVVRPRSSLGTRDSAIVIDDDEDEVSASVRKRKASISSPSRKSRPRDFVGCPICGAAQNHPAKTCPVVTAGPVSIKAALKQFDPSSSTWLLLKSLYEASIRSSVQPGQTTSNSAHPCPFCGTVCDRTIRECAEVHGGRKALKDRIRTLETARVGGQFRETDVGAVKAQVEKLYDAYLQWPKNITPV